jgi:hypothetical protein
MLGDAASPCYDIVTGLWQVQLPIRVATYFSGGASTI